VGVEVRVGGGLVGDEILKTNVSVTVGVTLAVLVGKGVKDGVRVSGIRAAVWLAAAAAVCATIISTTPGADVGISGAMAKGELHERISPATISHGKARLRKFIQKTPALRLRRN
jgi:hypothetical protein